MDPNFLNSIANVLKSDTSATPTSSPPQPQPPQPPQSFLAMLGATATQPVAAAATATPPPPQLPQQQQQQPITKEFLISLMQKFLPASSQAEQITKIMHMNMTEQQLAQYANQLLKHQAKIANSAEQQAQSAQPQSQQQSAAQATPASAVAPPPNAREIISQYTAASKEEKIVLLEQHPWLKSLLERRMAQSTTAAAPVVSSGTPSLPDVSPENCMRAILKKQQPNIPQQDLQEVVRSLQSFFTVTPEAGRLSVVQKLALLDGPTFLKKVKNIAEMLKATVAAAQQQQLQPAAPVSATPIQTSNSGVSVTPAVTQAPPATSAAVATPSVGEKRKRGQTSSDTPPQSQEQTPATTPTEPQSKKQRTESPTGQASMPPPDAVSSTKKGVASKKTGGAAGKKGKAGASAAADGEEADDKPQRLEDLGDITKLVGIDLSAEESMAEDMAEEEEVVKPVQVPRSNAPLLHKARLKTKLQRILNSKGVKSLDEEVLDYMSLAVEDRLKQLLELMIQAAEIRRMYSSAEQDPENRFVTSSEASVALMQQHKEMSASLQVERQRKEEYQRRQKEIEQRKKEAEAAKRNKEVDEKTRRQNTSATLDTMLGDISLKRTGSTLSSLGSRSGAKGSAAAGRAGSAAGAAQASPSIKSRVHKLHFTPRDVLFALEEDPMLRKSDLLYRLYLRLQKQE